MKAKGTRATSTTMVNAHEVLATVGCARQGIATSIAVLRELRARLPDDESTLGDLREQIDDAVVDLEEAIEDHLVPQFGNPACALAELTRRPGSAHVVREEARP